MRKIPAGQFKTYCLTLMEDVRITKEPILITKRGRPVAKLCPVPTGRDEFLGRLKGVIRITGDIESPVESPDA